MSSSDRGRGDAPSVHSPPGPSGTPPGSAEGADTYPNWLDRMQRARARHAAITKNLYTWSNYKNWAEKMRDNWDEEEAAAKSAAANAKPPGPGHRR